MWPPRPRFTSRRSMIAVAAVAALSGIRAMWTHAAEPRQDPRPDDPGPAADPTPPDPRGATPGRPDGPIVDASLIQLIANPDLYDGKPVRAQGFLHVEFEGTALYLSRDDANHLIARNGLWISFGQDPEGGAPEQSNRKFVLIEGVFDKELHGHKGLWSGGIRGVWRVMKLGKFYHD